MNFRQVLRLPCMLAAISGEAIGISAIVGYCMKDNSGTLRIMGIIAFVITASAMLLGRCCFRLKDTSSVFTIREGLAAVAAGWFSVVIIGALPYIFAGSFTIENAIFESASGFSTTGATIIDSSMVLSGGEALTKGIEGLPYCLLFWRSLTNWLGGMGIVVFALVIMPFLGIKGQQLYNVEVPGLKTDSDQFVPSAAFASKILLAWYAGLTLIETLLLYFGGMTLFDAVCHAFSMASSSGFSTKNDSIAYFKSPFIEWVCIFAMTTAACNVTLNFKVFFSRRWSLYFKDEEFRFFLSVILLSAVLITIQLWISGTGTNFAERFRCALFHVTSIISSTGFTTTDYAGWPLFAVMILFLLMFIGGCAGSTAGGMKCVRVLLFLKHARSEVVRCIFPRALTDIRLNGKRLEAAAISKCIAFLLLYAATFLTVAMLLPLLCRDMDFTTALSSSIACLSNMGPGFGKIGPEYTYTWMSVQAKLLLSFVMILGRLELYTILILFLPSFWKK